jgi:hypothetical protein
MQDILLKKIFIFFEIKLNQKKLLSNIKFIKIKKITIK